MNARTSTGQRAFFSADCHETLNITSSMRPTFAEVDLRAIRSNLSAVRNHTGVRVMAVVKANAYGHGMLPVVHSIVKHNAADHLGVAIIEEAVELRSAGIRMPVLVFSAPAAHQLELFVKHDIEATLCSIDTARRLNRLAAAAGKAVSVHIKVDTGMGRIGVAAAEAFAFFEAVRKLRHLRVLGLYMHFATSDESDLSFAYRQLSVFRSVQRAIRATGAVIPLVHCANSGAIMQIPEAYFDMVRPGIMMYGYPPSHETLPSLTLQPAMALKTAMSFVKTVPKGTSISYNRRYLTRRRSVIATVPVGYADGIHRSLLNKAEAIVGGKKYPVVGTICMDQMMIDLGPHALARAGDEVILMGRAGDQSISAWDIADKAGTIPYEITCSISYRVPRTYLHG
jgi:alanine racemase